MIPPAPLEALPAPSMGLARTLLQALPRAYGILFFSFHPGFGLTLMGLALLAGPAGMAGGLGALLAALVAWRLGVDRALLRTGFPLFNAVLSCGAVGFLAHSYGWPLPLMVLLWLLAALGSLLLTLTLQAWLGRDLGLSVQSLPSCVMVSLVAAIGVASGGDHPVIHGASWWAANAWPLPELLRPFFKALAAVVFQDAEPVGLLVYVALVLASPLAGWLALVGYGAGLLTLVVLGLPLSPQGDPWFADNVILSSLALGCGYFVASRASLVLAVVGASATALVAVGLHQLLGPLVSSPGLWSYNLVVLLVVAAQRQLPPQPGLIGSPGLRLHPEGVARALQVQRARWPEAHKPALFLLNGRPLQVTQGFDGLPTHQGPWRFALDFQWPGTDAVGPLAALPLHTHPGFGLPVYAPVAGTVVTLENRIDDHAIFDNDPQNNWGNFVVVRSEPSVDNPEVPPVHVMVAHLRQGSIVVRSGQVVQAGDLLAQGGNSGRSAVPHIHLQCQRGLRPGESTLPFVLKHYLEQSRDNGGWIYHLRGVPAVGAVVRSAWPSEALHHCFLNWLPGRYCYQLGAELHTLVLEFGIDGRYHLRSPSLGQTLVIRLEEGVMHADGLDGRRGGILPLLGLVLARVPCIDDPDVSWEDQQLALPFLRWPARMLHTMIDPYGGVPLVRYRYRVARMDQHFLLSLELVAPPSAPPLAPRILTARIQGRHGVVAIDGVDGAGQPIQLRLMDYAPLSP